MCTHGRQWLQPPCHGSSEEEEEEEREGPRDGAPGAGGHGGIGQAGNDDGGIEEGVGKGDLPVVIAEVLIIHTCREVKVQSAGEVKERERENNMDCRLSTHGTSDKGPSDSEKGTTSQQRTHFWTSFA